MATNVIIPSEGGGECTLSSCNVKVGDRVASGDLICTAETDKSVIDIVAPCAGVVLAILYQEGDEVQPFAPIAILGEANEDISALLQKGQPSVTQTAPKPALVQPETAPIPAAISQPEAAPIPAAVPQPVQAAVETTVQPASMVARAIPKELKLSPRAKLYVKEHGIDLTNICGTGFAGSVTEKDVMSNGVKTPRPDMPSEEKNYIIRKLTRVQEVSGQRVLESLQTSAQFTINARVCTDRLLALRKRMKAIGSALGMAGVTVNDLFLFAVSRTLPDFPQLNAVWSGKELHEYTAVHLSVAMDTDQGLMVPVIRHAEQKSLQEISREAALLAEKCRDRKQSQEELIGGTFTVSNLGGLGIEDFTPILNPPQVAILGVGCPVERLVMQDGELTTVRETKLSLTMDHRAVDGAPGARFLQKLCTNIESIDILLGV